MVVTIHRHECADAQLAIHRYARVWTSTFDLIRNLGGVYVTCGISNEEIIVQVTAVPSHHAKGVWGANIPAFILAIWPYGFGESSASDDLVVAAAVTLPIY